MRYKANRVGRVCKLLMSWGVLMFSTALWGQNYPLKPIRFIIGFPAGGSADAAARPLVAHMGSQLGIGFVIENHGGAAGSVAAQIVARAPADGYTLLWSSPGALTINRILEKNLPYNPDTAFIPVGRALSFCNALIVGLDTEFNSLTQLIAAAKARPGQISYATQGVGSAGHLSAKMLEKMSQMEMSHVPYKGGTEILTAVVGGQLPAAFLSSTSAASLKQRIRILAVTSLHRTSLLPEVASMSELGIKGYDASFWYGILVPAHTSEKIVSTLNQALKQAIADPEIERLEKNIGLSPDASSPAEFVQIIKNDFIRWKKVIDPA